MGSVENWHTDNSTRGMNAQYGTLEYYPSVLAVRRYSYRLGLRPESVPLRSRAFDRRFSRALAAGLVPRPTPCLSPCAHPWGRASSPSRATLNCARFAGTRGGEEIKKSVFLRDSTVLLFVAFCWIVSSLLKILCSLLRSRLVAYYCSFGIFLISRPRCRYRFLPSLLFWAGGLWLLQLLPHFPVGIRVRSPVLPADFFFTYVLLLSAPAMMIW